MKAVYGQLDRIIGCLLEFSAAKDSKTYSDARALLKAAIEGEYVETAIEGEGVGTASHNLPSYSFFQ